MKPLFSPWTGESVPELMVISRHSEVFDVRDAHGYVGVLVALDTARATEAERRAFEDQITEARRYVARGFRFLYDEGTAVAVERVDDGTLTSGQRYYVLVVQRSAAREKGTGVGPSTPPRGLPS